MFQIFVNTFLKPKREFGIPWEFIDNYSKVSTIHGIKYVGEKAQHWGGRIFWIITFIVSIFFCTKNIIEIYKVRHDRPVMISLAKKLTPIYEIPFTAVTICPEMKVSCNKFNLTEIINRKNRTYTRDELDNLSALSHVCSRNLFDDDIRKILANEKIGFFNVVEKLNELSNSLEVNFFHECRFGSWKFGNCKEYFHKVLTDVGICYTFNFLDHTEFINNETMHYDLHLPNHGKVSNWFLEKDYNSMKVNVYPLRVVGAGLQSGLSVFFKINKSMICSSCVSEPQGFRVALHMPVEMPSLSNQFYSIPFRHETSIIIKPNMIYASKNIKDYDPNSRQCYFSHERKLKFYKIYSKLNCEIECKADYLLSQCGCVKFSMPRSKETSICNITQLECVYQAEISYNTRDLEKSLLEKQLKREKKRGTFKKNVDQFEKLNRLGPCNCLASCVNIKYDVELSQTENAFNENGFIAAKMNVYFKEKDFSRLKRYEIYGWSDFLSNSGGTLGLFMGCSLLSFVEIIYHLITYCVTKLQNRKKLAFNSS